MSTRRRYAGWLFTLLVAIALGFPTPVLAKHDKDGAPPYGPPSYAGPKDQQAPPYGPPPYAKPKH